MLAVYWDSEQGWSSFHVEHLAMLWACRHFKPYLLGKHFLLRTDHQPLVSLNKVTGQQMDRIKAELEDFSFTVEYIPGDKMPADGLSRQIAAIETEKENETPFLLCHGTNFMTYRRKTLFAKLLSVSWNTIHGQKTGPIEILSLQREKLLC